METYYKEMTKDIKAMNNDSLIRLSAVIWEDGCEMYSQGCAIEPEAWADWRTASDLVDDEMKTRGIQ